MVNYKKAGGVVVGDNHNMGNDGTKGGIFKGARHSEGGIPVKVVGGGVAEVEDGEPIIIPESVQNPNPVQFEGQKMTPKQVLSKINQRAGGVPIKKRGGMLEDGGNINISENPIVVKPSSVVITRGALLDKNKYEFEGEMLTNKEILSRINELGGGVAFEKGGSMPKAISTTGKKYKYKGEDVEDVAIVASCGCEHKMSVGGELGNDDAEMDYFIVRLDTDDWSDAVYMGFDENKADSYFEDADISNLPDKAQGSGGSVTKEKYKVKFKYINKDEAVEDYPVEDFYDDSDYWEEIENGYKDGDIDEEENRNIVGTNALEAEEKEQAELVLSQVVSLLQENTNVINYEKAGFYIRPSYYFIYKVNETENIEIRVSNHSLRPSNIESNPNIILDRSYVKRTEIAEHVKDWDESNYNIAATDFNDSLVEIIHTTPKNRVAFFSAVIFAVENETENDFDDDEVSANIVYEEEEYNLSEYSMSAQEIYDDIIERVEILALNNEGGDIFEHGGNLEQNAINDPKVTFENFHIDTFANFTKISKKEVPDSVPDFQSKSGSRYWYVEDYVIRQSDHWGRTIASCNWLIDSKAQKGFTQGKCKLDDFHRQMLGLLNDEKSIGKTFKVVKTVLLRNGGGRINIEEMTGKFKKSTSDNFIFDNFRVAYQTLAYVEPLDKFEHGGKIKVGDKTLFYYVDTENNLQSIHAKEKLKDYLPVHVLPTVRESDYYISTVALFEHITLEDYEKIDSTEYISISPKTARTPEGYSTYKIKDGTVYRCSNHWGRVGTCLWYYSPYFEKTIENEQVVIKPNSEINKKAYEQALAKSGMSQGRFRHQMNMGYISYDPQQQFKEKKYNESKSYYYWNISAKCRLEDFQRINKNGVYIFDDMNNPYLRELLGYKASKDLGYIQKDLDRQEKRFEFEHGGSFDQIEYRTLAYLPNGNTGMYEGKLGFHDLYTLYGVLAEKIHHIDIVKKDSSSDFGKFYTWSENKVFENFMSGFAEGYPIVQFDRLDDGTVEIIEAIGLLQDGSSVEFDGYDFTWKKQFGGGGTMPDDDNNLAYTYKLKITKNTHHKYSKFLYSNGDATSVYYEGEPNIQELAKKGLEQIRLKKIEKLQAIEDAKTYFTMPEFAAYNVIEIIKKYYPDVIIKKIEQAQNKMSFYIHIYMHNKNFKIRVSNHEGGSASFLNDIDFRYNGYKTEDEYKNGLLEVVKKISSNNSISNKIIDNQFGGGGTMPENEDDKIYHEWKSLVNMPKSEIEAFYNSEEGKHAGLSEGEAKSLDIHSGRESARHIISMKSKPYSQWDANDFEWAKRQISFIKRMSGNKGALYDAHGNKTRKHLALLIWGHDPKK